MNGPFAINNQTVTWNLEPQKYEALNDTRLPLGKKPKKNTAD